MARTSGVEPGEFEVGLLLRPGERGRHCLAQTLLGNRLEVVGPHRDPLLRYARVDHERIEHPYLLVDRGNDIGAVGLGGGVQVCRSHGDHPSNATLPAAIVSRTLPLTVWPSSHEFAERERKSLSETRLLAFRSSRTRFAGAPTAIRGASRPYACAGPADIRSSSVSSFSSPGSTRCV